MVPKHFLFEWWIRNSKSFLMNKCPTKLKFSSLPLHLIHHDILVSLLLLLEYLNLFKYAAKTQANNKDESETIYDRILLGQTTHPIIPKKFKVTGLPTWGGILFVEIYMCRKEMCEDLRTLNLIHRQNPGTPMDQLLFVFKLGFNVCKRFSFAAVVHNSDGLVWYS